MSDNLELKVLDGTAYQVHVTRCHDGDYEVEVTKPAHESDPYAEHEVIGHRYMENGTTKQGLENLVERIIAEDKPSLVGTYTGGVTNGA